MWKHCSLIALNFAVFLLMTGVGLIVVLLPRKMMMLSGSMSEVGYLASAFAVPYVLVQLPIGRLSDIFGFRKFIIGGYILCAFTGVLYYYCETSVSVLAGRMIQGVGEAPVWALAPALLSVLYPSDKGRYMGIYNASIHAGLMFGSLSSILLLRIWAGNEPFLFFAASSALGGIILFFFLEDISPKQAVKEEKYMCGKPVLLMKNAENAIVLCGVILYGAGYGIFLTVIPAYLINIKNYTRISTGIFFTVFYIAISISQIIAGPLSDKKGGPAIMCSGLLMTAAGLASFTGFMNPFFINSLLFLASLGLGIFCISSMTFLNESVLPELRGTVSGAFYLFWGIGFFFGPMIVGRTDSVVIFGFEIYVLSCIFLTEALFLFFLTRKRDNPVHLETFEK